jgi:hypothetical protein
MTRDLNSGTKVQRGDSDAVSQKARRLGYEPKDAPAKGVAWGTAAFIGLMVLGLIVAAPLVWGLEQSHPSAVPPRTVPKPPLPRLLVDAPAQRHRIEARQEQRLERGPITIEQAMRRVAALGWTDAAPAPSAIEAARNHVEAAE